MDQFVQQLASLCRQHVTRSKWAFVPTQVTVRVAPRLFNCQPPLRILAAIAVAIAAGLVGHSQTPVAQAQHSRNFDGVVSRVMDGDTIQVTQHHGRVVSVRLDGIDCPEAGQPFGRAALLFTRREVFDKTVTVRVRSTDRYGRLVGRVNIDDKDLSTALVEAGLAWHYVEYSSDIVLAAAEKTARTAHRGMWIDPHNIPPWVARRKVRAVDPIQPVVTAIEFRGNSRSLVYHRSSCKNANCQRCSAIFQTEQEAQRAGYQPAGDCLRRTH